MRSLLSDHVFSLEISPFIMMSDLKNQICKVDGLPVPENLLIIGLSNANSSMRWEGHGVFKLEDHDRIPFNGSGIVVCNRLNIPACPVCFNKNSLGYTRLLDPSSTKENISIHGKYSRVHLTTYDGSAVYYADGMLQCGQCWKHFLELRISARSL